MYFETFILTVMFKNAKLNIKKKKKRRRKEMEKKKKQPKFSQILYGQKRANNIFFLGLPYIFFEFFSHMFSLSF